jgi:hypothetical protein
MQGGLRVFWVLGVSAVSSLPLLFALGRRQDQAVQRGWQCALTPRGERLYRSLAHHVEADLELAVLTYSEAFAVGERGGRAEALRLLSTGHSLVERCASKLVRLLAGMATFSRQTRVVASLPPLRPRAFRLRALTSLAALGRALDAVLVSASERFRLRLYLLGHGYGLAARTLLRDSERMLRRGSWTEAEWRRIQSIHGDFTTLTGELLGSLRALLTSLSAVPIDEAP